MPSKTTREERKEKGLCPICGKRPPSKYYSTCDVCREKDRLQQKKAREKRKSERKCDRCGKPLKDGEKIRCKECCDKQYSITKSNREYAKKAGICTVCQVNLVLAGQTICETCREKQREYNRKNPPSQEQRKKKNEKQKREREARKKQSVCIECGKRKAEIGKVRCHNCLVKNKLRQRKRYRKQNGITIERAERPSYGLCYICGAEIDIAAKVCSKCKERITSYLPEEKNNEIWRKDNNWIFRKGNRT